MNVCIPSARLTAAALLFGTIPLLNAQTTATSSQSAKDDETIVLSVFEVTTSADIGYQSTNAAEATRMDTPIENIPMNVTIFNQQFIDDLLATDTTQLLAYESSSVKTNENDGFLARGMASVGGNFLNGFAQTSGFGSQPLANIERVEVIRGPGAILCGSDTYGGVYNRITKQPRPNAFTSGRLILSDAGSYRLEFDHNTGGLPLFGGKKLMGRVNGIFEDGETWFGQVKKEKAIAPSLTWNIGPNTKVIFEYFYNWRETQATWETPVHGGDPLGMVTGDGTYRVIPRKANWVSPDDYRHNTRNVASYDLRHAFSKNLQFRSQFQFEDKKQDNLETQAGSNAITILADTVLLSRYWRHEPRDTENYRTRNELIWNFDSGPIHHRLLLGHGWVEQYDWNHRFRSVRNNGGLKGTALTGNGKLTDAQAGPLLNLFPDVTYAQFLANPQLAGYNLNNLMPMNMFDRSAEPPVPGIDARPELFPDIDTKTYLANQDFYANDVFSFAKERVFVMAGVRHTEVVRKTWNWLSGTFPNKVVRPDGAYTYRDPAATVPSIGAVLHLNSAKTFTLYGNLNRSFKPQFNVQPDGSDLKPEEGKQKEVGLRFNLMNGRISALVSYFDILVDNVTKADPDRPGQGYYIQESDQRSTGLEFSVNARLTDSWNLMSGLSNTDARNDKTGVGKDLSPKYRFTMFNRFNFNRGPLKGLSFSLGTIYTDERSITSTTERNEPSWTAPAYWRLDGIVGYSFKPGKGKYRYNVSLKVSNFLDEQEIYYVAYNNRYTIDPGREWQLACGVRF